MPAHAERKICLLGDSHSAALRRGWSLIQSGFPDVEITFFAAKVQQWPSIEIQDGKLVAVTESLREHFQRSSPGSQEISGTFDTYILSGLRLALSFPLRLRTHHEYTDWDAYRAAVASHVRDTACANVLSKLRQITAAPVFVVAGPHQPSVFCKSSPLLDEETAAQLHANFIAECEAFTGEHSAMFIPQPIETLARNGVTTRMEFANPSSDPERKDRRHCNTAYGVIALNHILQTISKAPAP